MGQAGKILLMKKTNGGASYPQVKLITVQLNIICLILYYGQVRNGKKISCGNCLRFRFRYSETNLMLGIMLIPFLKLGATTPEILCPYIFSLLPSGEPL